MADEAPLAPGGPGHRNAGKRIEDYGLIGNTLSAALVGLDGSIDWLCLPRFDSEACFAALLGTPENGSWRIAPRASARVSRRYLADTAVLETCFETGGGRVAITDFMPFTEDEEKVDVVRIVTGVSGEVELDMELTLRFGYGQDVPWVRRRDYGLSAIAGPDAIELHTPVELEGKNLTTVARFSVREGESVPLTLSYHPSHRQPHFVPDRHESLERTSIWWREWVKAGNFVDMPDKWRELVVRSLITLKMLTYRSDRRHRCGGDDVAAGSIGGMRNWDYRFCWMRDTDPDALRASQCRLSPRGRGWREWLLRAVAGRPGAAADHVRHRRRAPAGGVRAHPGSRVRRQPSSAHRQRRE